MAEIFTKEDGKLKSLGDVDLDKINALSSQEDLDKCLKDFWNDKKSGKHPELIKKHKAILLQDLKANPNDLFEQINQNKFTFSDFEPININTFLQKSKLDSYLKPEYVQHALEVTTHQPQIGKGEFLLVSCFKNINFAKESGDLVDDDGNRIEVKGSHSTIGGPRI